MYVVTATLKMENQQGPPTAQGALLCYVAAWMGGGIGGDWMAESLCCSPETMTTLLISYNPIQNKKLKTKRMDVYFMTSGAPEGSGSLCTPCRYSQPLVWGRLQTAICCFCCPDEGRHPGLPSPSRLTPKGQQTQRHVLPVGEPGSAAAEERGWPFLCRPPSCAFLRDARWCEDPGNEG